MQSYGLLGFINDTQSVWECRMHIGSCQEVVYSMHVSWNTGWRCERRNSMIFDRQELEIFDEYLACDPSGRCFGKLVSLK